MSIADKSKSGSGKKTIGEDFMNIISREGSRMIQYHFG